MKAYQKKYQRKRYLDKKKMLIEYLGGKCSSCGCSDNLEFDHIDASTKEFTIMSRWKLPISVMKDELDKCQLLCKECHREKTRIDLGQTDWSGFPEKERERLRHKAYYQAHRDEINKRRRDRRKTQDALQKRSTGGST